VKSATGQLCLLEERQVGLSQLYEAGGGLRLTTDDDERPSVVVGAVTVLGTGSGEMRVLPDAQMVSEPLEMTEPGPRQFVGAVLAR
jgi:hypothetical protein